MNSNSIIKTLTTYKKLIKKRSYQKQLLEEETVILYVATLLDRHNEEILKLCLDILGIISEDNEFRNYLVSILGVFEAVETLLIKLRHSKLKGLKKQAETISNNLKRVTNPKTGSHKVTKKNNQNKSCMYRLYIEELTMENKISLNNSLLEIKGVISFVIDVELKNCIIRCHFALPLEDLLTAIINNCKMNPQLVLYTSERKEVLLDISQIESLQDVLFSFNLSDEEDTHLKHQLQTALEATKNESSNWFTTISNFWSHHLYW